MSLHKIYLILYMQLRVLKLKNMKQITLQGGDFLNLKELEQVLFKSSSDSMRKQGRKVFNKGLVSKIRGKKIDSTYSIYGRVGNLEKSEEFSTYIKIDLKNKKLKGINCTCDNFRELQSKGYSFMCSHITATMHKFFSEISKGTMKKTNKSPDKEELEKNKEKRKSMPESKLKVKENIKEEAKTVRIVRVFDKDYYYYEMQYEGKGKKIKIKPDELREALYKIKDEKIKFKYKYLEIKTSVLKGELPLTFTLKERKGKFVLTTQKQFPIALNNKKDAYLFNWKIYLPSKKQIQKYLPLCEKLQKQGEIIYPKSIENYKNIVSTINSISKNFNIYESVREFASNFLKPEICVYKDKGNIYCKIEMNYGSRKINILTKDESKENPIRHYKKEEKILMDMEKYGFVREEDRFLFLGGDNELFDILSEKGQNIHAIGKVKFGNGFQGMKVYNASSIKVKFYEEEGYYDFSYDINGIELRELNSARDSFKSNKRFYKTKNNGFIDFEDESVRGFFYFLETLDIEDGKAKIEKNKSFYISEIIKNNRIGFIEGSQSLKEIEEGIETLKSQDKTIPKELKAKLREYQVEGFKWFKNLSKLGFGGILADEMGLGKTIQTITFLLSEKSKKTLIITPTSLIYNWKDEIEKFAPSLNVSIVHGKKDRRQKALENLEECDVILTTYGTLRRDIDKYENVIFDYCIIDEAQNIKNPLVQNTRAVKKVKAKGKFALTGTPIENNLLELWSIFDFIMPKFLYSKDVFIDKFVNSEEDSLENLKLLIKPFILRRTKKEVMKELPDKIEKKFLVEMTPSQKAIYKSYIKTIREKIKENSNGKIEIFSYLTRMRQICLDPSLVLDEYSGESAKIKVAMEIINNHVESNKKVLLFSQFTSVLHNIGKKLNEKGIDYFTLDGTTRPKKRVDMVKEFNEENSKKVFLISLKAGGTGLNLTSANLVIHFDPWWNPAVEDQATDRAHRINVVNVIKLIAKGTIEEKIILLQEDKKQLINNIINGELKNSSLISKLSKKDLVKLFER